MNKKLITALAALTLIIPISANAASLQNKSVTQPTIAILDTALDTSIPSIKSNVIYEACVVQWNSCPNGLGEMEGTNSAVLPTSVMSNNGFDHGTQIASLAVATNPNVRIVFVRIIGADSSGFRQPSGEQTVWAALDWVIRNKAKFNIQAVSMSQGHHVLGAAGTDYCPKTPITESKIKTLADIFALGTTQAITVGGKKVNVAGTSASAIIAATQWATVSSAKPTLTYSQIYDLLSKTSVPTSNSKVSGGKLISLNGALNG